MVLQAYQPSLRLKPFYTPAQGWRVQGLHYAWPLHTGTRVPKICASFQMCLFHIYGNLIARYPFRK